MPTGLPIVFESLKVTWTKHFIDGHQMLAQDFSCVMVMLTKSEQCRHNVCSNNLPVQKNCWKVTRCCSGYIEADDCTVFHYFQCNVVWSLLVNIAWGFDLWNVVPTVLRQHWTEFLLCNVFCSLKDSIT